jgi:hypothetical protein
MNLTTLSGVTLHNRGGYSDHACGYSRFFSWWRGAGAWIVMGHGQFCGSGLAITDDYGNLVEVKR